MKKRTKAEMAEYQRNRRNRLKTASQDALQSTNSVTPIPNYPVTPKVVTPCNTCDIVTPKPCPDVTPDIVTPKDVTPAQSVTPCNAWQASHPIVINPVTGERYTPDQLAYIQSRETVNKAWEVKKDGIILDAVFRGAGC